MEHDIHPERPRPVEPRAPKVRPPWLDPLLCVVLPALAANVILSVLRGLPWIETIWFAAGASGLAVWSLRLEKGGLPAENPQSEERFPILIALIIALSCFALAWNAAIVFASIGIAALAFAFGGLCWGAAAARSRLGSFAFLLFAFPWIDPAAGLVGFPWRGILVNGAALAARPLVGVVTAQGTTLGAESMKLALTSDVGGFWQAQFFLLCALGLVVGSAWTPARRAAWLGLSALLAAAAYFGFVASYFIVGVLAAGRVAPFWGAALEIAWWLAAFGILCWLARDRSRKAAEEKKNADERRESMFPEDVPTTS